MTVRNKIKSFFRRSKPQAKAEQPTPKAAEKKAPEAPEKKGP